MTFTLIIQRMVLSWSEVDQANKTIHLNRSITFEFAENVTVRWTILKFPKYCKFVIEFEMINF